MKKILVALALLGATPAAADTAYDRCARAANNNSDYSSCGSAWIAREETRLNRAWRAIYPGLPQSSKSALLAEQRAWIAYKDKSCRWRASGDWGREGQVIHYPTCRAKVVADRADYLSLIARDMKER